MTRKEIFEEFERVLGNKDRKSHQIVIILIGILFNMSEKYKYGFDVYRKLYGKCKNIDEVIKCYGRLRKEYYDFRKMLDIDW